MEITSLQHLRLNESLQSKKLSSGEKQRVLLARALLSGKKVLMMDEATQALDSKLEDSIWRALDEAFDVIISISHKWSLVARCDKVWVMESGELVESGAVLDLAGREDTALYHLFWRDLALKHPYRK
eukprot:gb/GEZN01031041.1/.p2 GENE.gb/GEZN01031041.1/~~gb/GEZN01031041.1/.p2  ORF type:complete len:127 (-),score=26.99 gb/GEZN01031041.1/:60-440(-)